YMPPNTPRGFTLIEVLIAIVIMAIIATLTGQALHTATTSSDATNDAVKRLNSVDRTWTLLEADLRNTLPRAIVPSMGEPIPPLIANRSSDYWLRVFRGGVVNPLHAPRSELVRIGYRLTDNVLWRDTWVNIASLDERDALKQKLMTDVKDIVIRVLSNSATSLAAGPWLQDWPASGVQANQLPRALEVTIQTEDYGEMKRLFPLLAGEDFVYVPRVPQNPNNNNGKNNNNGRNDAPQNNNNDANQDNSSQDNSNNSGDDSSSQQDNNGGVPNE
ncbi:MAG TPA: type II secretion system minor pseudopilin GspJ, partial [Marinagarivorans sp.]|nr:type II secretion system minor pseudopilin GspJ [Marinagarivorans sp.]